MNFILDFNNIKFKQPLNDIYYCKICQFIYDYVYQAECGCRYCSTCLNRAIENSKCQLCDTEFTEKAKIKDKAFQRELENNCVNCIKCEWAGTLVNYLKHYLDDHTEFLCKYCKEIFESVEMLREHMKLNLNGSCNLKISGDHCIYQHVGCNNSKNCKQQENVALHLSYVYNSIKEKIVRNRDFQKSGILKEKTRRGTINEIDSTHEFEIFSNNNTQILKEQIFNHFQLKNKLELSQANEKKLEEEVNNLKKTLMLTQSSIITLEQRLQEQERTSYNGTYIWKIINTNQNINYAKSGKQTSYYSLPFYTHAYGYKMCARIYLNGDGMGRGTHVSVFFVLMKGEYDSLLTWPFKQKVTFVLIDQLASESKENIFDAFRPDSRSASFKRPDTDMNIASGIPLFCTLPKLHSVDHQYIKDDCVFMKIVVDTKNLDDM